MHIWHVYSANETLSNDTKVNELVTLTFILRIANLGFVAAGGIRVSQTHPPYFASEREGVSIF